MTTARGKHVPERTCVACRGKRAKRELVRIVRTPQGGVGIDPGGRQAGRGAYLCLARECWEKSLRKGQLEYALRVRLSPDDQARLAEFAQGLAQKGAGVGVAT